MTLAKGIGNGFPLAAVVTTPGESSLHESALQLSHYVPPCTEIADTMTKALHFNTYGGNPMACAVGSAVLDVSIKLFIVRNTDNLNLSRVHRYSRLLSTSAYHKPKQISVCHQLLRTSNSVSGVLRWPHSLLYIPFHLVKGNVVVL